MNKTPLELLADNIQRQSTLLEEIKETIGDRPFTNLPPMLEAFLRAAKTKDVNILHFQLRECLQFNVPLQELERVCRSRALPCWLVVVENKDLEKEGETKPYLTFSFYSFAVLAESLFKEEGSYLKNFKALETVSLFRFENTKDAEKALLTLNEEAKDFRFGLLNL